MRPGWRPGRAVVAPVVGADEVGGDAHAVSAHRHVPSGVPGEDAAGNVSAQSSLTRATIAPAGGQRWAVCWQVEAAISGDHAQHVDDAREERLHCSIRIVWHPCRHSGARFRCPAVTHRARPARGRQAVQFRAGMDDELDGRDTPSNVSGEDSVNAGWIAETTASGFRFQPGARNRSPRLATTQFVGP